MSNKKTIIPQSDYVFTTKNYRLFLIAIGMVMIGFLLMVGGNSEDPNVFNKSEIYSFRRITLAPVIVLLGYIFGIYAIMKKSKE